MSGAGKIAALGIAALFALQGIWHGLLWPSAIGNRWLIALLFSLPLLPSLVLLVRGRPSALFWGGVAALFYFCHGIAEAWTIAQTRPLALAEVAISTGIIVAGSWDAMKARFSKRK